MIAAERKTALLNAMQKLEAYRQIQNEMGRAVAAFNFRQADRLLSFFALDKADVSLETPTRASSTDRKQSKPS